MHEGAIRIFRHFQREQTDTGGAERCKLFRKVTILAEASSLLFSSAHVKRVMYWH